MSSSSSLSATVVERAGLLVGKGNVQPFCYVRFYLSIGADVLDDSLFTARFPRCVSRFSPRVSFTWSIVWWRGLCFQQEQDKDYKDEATRQKIEDSGLKIHTIAVMGQGGRSGGVVGPGIDMPLISAAYINPDDSVQMARWSR